jgi:hypothetical protein
MKKVILGLAVMALVSCGGSSTSDNVADTTALATDTLVVTDSVVIDSSAVGIPEGGGKQDGSIIK